MVFTFIYMYLPSCTHKMSQLCSQTYNLHGTLLPLQISSEKNIKHLQSPCGSVEPPRKKAASKTFRKKSFLEMWLLSQGPRCWKKCWFKLELKLSWDFLPNIVLWIHEFWYLQAVARSSRPLVDHAKQKLPVVQTWKPTSAPLCSIFQENLCYRNAP